MRVTVSQKNLKKALGVIEHIIPRGGSLPILNNILIKTENGRLKLTTTNLEIGINYFIGAKIDDGGEVAVPAKIFYDFINNNTEEKINLTTKNNTLHITSDKQKTQILTSNPKDFPIIPKIKTQPFCVVPSKNINEGLVAIFDSVSTSETRPELAGAFIQFNQTSISFAATDSFRLTEKIISNKSKEKLGLIVPRNTVSELIKITNNLEGNILIKFEDNQISFSNEDFELVSRIIVGTYPEYKKVIPDKWLSKTLVSKDELDKKTRLVGVFSSNIADIKVVCSEKQVTMTAKNPEKGEAQIGVDAILKSDPFEVSLNYHYLLDGLKTISTKNVVIEYTGPGSPIMLKPEDDKKDTVYLIMPLRN